MVAKVTGFVTAVLIFTAAGFALANGGSGQRYLQAVKAEGGNFIALYVADQDFLNPDGCDRSHIVLMRAIDPGYEEKLSLALAALMGHRKVGLWLVGCVDTPWNYTAPIVKVITVYAE